MNATVKSAHPLVSVVIPCYNQAHFLAPAIESVRQQTYPNIEIVVVDDGSKDDTAVVAKAHEGVQYHYQENKGLPSARNAGIMQSKGDFLLFLDADDWLYPEGVKANVGQLLQNPEVAFVSGSFDAFYAKENKTEPKGMSVDGANHYCHLLKGNYIGMVATVMFRREVFEEFLFDASLKNCEDYDLYLRVARKHPVSHHGAKVAVYRFHDANMSHNIPKMLKGALGTLERQRPNLKTPEEQSAYQRGRHIWKQYYSKELYQHLAKEKMPVSLTSVAFLLKNSPKYALKYALRIDKAMVKTQVKKLLPSSVLRWLHAQQLYKNYKPGIGRVSFGDFGLTKPFSREFGYDRGGPIDRYYIERFLEQMSDSVQGRVLEIGDNEYTLKYGGERVRQSDILHVDESNTKATFIADISDAPHLPDSAFDCILLTQTLHLIYDVKGALRTCHRILKPGGSLLLTVPGITPIDHGEWKDTWYWAFTDKAMHRLLAETFPRAKTEISTYGNVFSASKFLYGLGLQEVPKGKLDYHDPHFQVTVAVKATKGTV